MLLHLTYSGMGHVVQCKPTMHFPTQKKRWSTSVIPVDHVNSAVGFVLKPPKKATTRVDETVLITKCI